MRPWAHESELAGYLETQRSIARARTPSTPTFPDTASSIPNEDLRRLDEMATALYNLQLRLANNEELADYTGRILDYVNQLRQDFPIPTPENAFIRLQPLRDLIFWLPPAVLHVGESDLAALTLLSHLYATALTLEPIFADIGGAYLGTMCLLPTDRIHEILKTRRNSQPQDSSCQVALALVEIPMQIAGTYKQQQQQQQQRSVGNMEGCRASPQASPYIGSHVQLATSQDTSRTLYSNSPARTPQGLAAGGGAYFPASTAAMPISRDSPVFRPQALVERSMSAGSQLSSMQMYGGQQHYVQPQPRSSHETGARMDYFGQTQAPYQYYGGMHAQTRFVAPSQLWA